METSTVQGQLPSDLVPQGSATATSLLLGLPRELRNHIFDDLFCGFCVNFQQQGLDITLSYDASTDNATSALPLWLLTNKQILHEGLQQLYHRARCTKCLRDTRPHSTDPRKCRIESQNQPSTPGKQLLDLRYIHTVHLDNIKVASFTVYPAGMPATLCIFAMDVVFPLRQCLKALQGSLKHLKVSFTLPDTYPEIYEEDEWEVDVSDFEDFGPLESAGFCIRQPPRIDTGQVEHVRACAVVMSRLQEELVRVSKKLVGGDEHGCMVRDWIACGGGESDQVKAPWEHDWHLEVRRGGVVEALQKKEDYREESAAEASIHGQTVPRLLTFAT